MGIEKIFDIEKKGSIEYIKRNNKVSKIEKERREALSRRDAKKYYKLTNKLGIQPQNIEDKILYEQGKFEIEQHEEEFKEREKLKEKVIGLEKQSEEYELGVYKKYNIPSKRPERFWDAFNYAKKVPPAERPNQEKVRTRYGEKMRPFYWVPTKVSEAKKVLIKMFPEDAKDIKKLSKKQIWFAYHSINGLW